MDTQALELDLDRAALGSLVRDIGIPPRPSLLIDLQTELLKDDQDPRNLSRIASSDVAIAAALLKTANSPVMGLSRRAETIDAAIQLLGLRQCECILTELVLRKVMPTDGPILTRFWDVACKRAHAMHWLAREEQLLSADLAYTFGLFADVGIPLLMCKFILPSYLNTLSLANESDQCFTEVEQERHHTDHTVVGALLARDWGVSQTVLLAVRLHHDYRALDDNDVPEVVRRLVALGLVAEHVIQRYNGQNRHAEWTKGGELAMKALAVNEGNLMDWCDELHEQFDAGL